MENFGGWVLSTLATIALVLLVAGTIARYAMNPAVVVPSTGGAVSGTPAPATPIVITPLPQSPLAVATLLVQTTPLPNPQDSTSNDGSILESAPAARSAVARSEAASASSSENDATGYSTKPGCSYLIKAIVDANGARRYYRPDDPNYWSVEVKSAQGDRWFCTLGDAQNAGWRDASLP